jgi:hypothetical protein
MKRRICSGMTRTRTMKLGVEEEDVLLLCAVF